MSDGAKTIVITGAAGLVGQNLIARLEAKGGTSIIAIDKHKANLDVLTDLHPHVRAIAADLAEPGKWEAALDGAEAVVMAHAQIGGNSESEFTRNNITASERLLDGIDRRGGRYVVHISSSVLNSAASDWYTQSKKAQEQLVVQSGNPHVILRPTLMFGWFDRKHLGWLARFMRRTPIFPIPGNGKFLRQPLYAGDFCAIVAQCLAKRPRDAAYNITGLEEIDYIDLIRLVREATGSKTRIVTVPYPAFRLMLATYALVDRNPPFTTQQLKALATPDVFEVIDWPKIFAVTPTPLKRALTETFCDPTYSSVELEF